VPPRRSLDPVVAGALASAGFLAWYMATRPGGSPVTLAQEAQAVLLGSRTLTPAQRAMVDVIGQEFAAAGLGWLTVAAVANAYAESRLDPLAGGDSGESIGLFQLYSHGAGEGMSIEQRQDPRQNTRRIIEVVQGGEGAPVRAARGLASNAELASLFAHHVERCSECGWNEGDAQLAIRAGHVTEIYGSEIAAVVPR